MPRRVLVCFLVLNISLSSRGQKCDDETGFFEFLDSLSDLYEDSSIDTVKLWNDSLRTLKIEWNYAVNTLIPVGTIDIHPAGFEVGFKKQLSKLRRIYIGGSLSLYNYGYEKYDTLMGDYDYISTNNSLYSFDLSARYNLVDIEGFIAFFGMKAGTVISSTVSKAIDSDCSCEQRRPWRMGKINSNKALYFGTFLGLQLPMGSL